MGNAESLAAIIKDCGELDRAYATKEDLTRALKSRWGSDIYEEGPIDRIIVAALDMQEKIVESATNTATRSTMAVVLSELRMRAPDPYAAATAAAAANLDDPNDTSVWDAVCAP